MTADPSWTPAARPGLVPLRPLRFGEVLGRSFVALRHNPRVLFGFAIGVQIGAYLVLVAATGALTFWMVSRLQTVAAGSADFDDITAGSVAAVIIVTILLTIATSLLTVIVQGVVIADTTSAVVAEQRRLRGLWRRVAPAVWRLVGYSLLLFLAVLVVFAVAGLGVFGLASLAAPTSQALAIGVAVLTGILILLAAIPLWLWLATKLAVVPAALVMEGATIRGAIARSWRLTRGRFWPILGVLVVVQLSFAVLGQLVTVPFALLSVGLGQVFAPTGEPDPTGAIGFLVGTLLTQVVSLIVQSVALVVFSSAIALVYVDARMRHEALDQDLLHYREARDAGTPDVPDPYRAHIARPTAPPTAWAPPPSPATPSSATPPSSSAQPSSTPPSATPPSGAPSSESQPQPKAPE